MPGGPGAYSGSSACWPIVCWCCRRHRFPYRGSHDAAGLTSAHLLRRTYRVQAGDTVLIHAIAGGVGLIACQWAKALGPR